MFGCATRCSTYMYIDDRDALDMDLSKPWSSYIAQRNESYRMKLIYIYLSCTCLVVDRSAPIRSPTVCPSVKLWQSWQRRPPAGSKLHSIERCPNGQQASSLRSYYSRTRASLFAGAPFSTKTPVRVLRLKCQQRKSNRRPVDPRPYIYLDEKTPARWRVVDNLRGHACAAQRQRSMNVISVRVKTPHLVSCLPFICIPVYLYTRACASPAAWRITRIAGRLFCSAPLAESIVMVHICTGIQLPRDRVWSKSIFSSTDLLSSDRKRQATMPHSVYTRCRGHFRGIYRHRQLHSHDGGAISCRLINDLINARGRCAKVFDIGDGVNLGHCGGSTERGAGDQ